MGILHIDTLSWQLYTLSMARDIIHGAVRNALIKDDWVITADPFRIQYEEFDLSADLSAERALSAEKGNQKIVVEVKSFVGRSFVRELQQAMGQYAMYLEFMSILDVDHKLFVAISTLAYERYFGQRAVKALLRQSQMPLLIVNIEQEEIVQWIN